MLGPRALRYSAVTFHLLDGRQPSTNRLCERPICLTPSAFLIALSVAWAPKFGLVERWKNPANEAGCAMDWSRAILVVVAPSDQFPPLVGLFFHSFG